MIFVLVPNDFKLQFWAVFGVEIYKFSSFTTDIFKTLIWKKKMATKIFFMIASYPTVRWSSITWSKENSLWQEAAISQLLEHWTLLHFIFLTSNFLKMVLFKIFLCLLYSHLRFVYNRWTWIEPLCSLFRYYIDFVNSRVQVTEKDL